MSEKGWIDRNTAADHRSLQTRVAPCTRIDAERPPRDAALEMFATDGLHAYSLFFPPVFEYIARTIGGVNTVYLEQTRR